MSNNFSREEIQARKNEAVSIIADLRTKCNVALRDNRTNEWVLYPTTKFNTNSAFGGGVRWMPGQLSEVHIRSLGYTIIEDRYPLVDESYIETAVSTEKSTKEDGPSNPTQQELDQCLDWLEESLKDGSSPFP